MTLIFSRIVFLIPKKKLEDYVQNNLDLSKLLIKGDYKY
jgi:hypothetical protein